MKFLIPAVLLLLAPVLSAQVFESADDDMVDSCFKLSDSNKDGKISSEEARELRVTFFKELKEAWAVKNEDKASELAAAIEDKYLSAEAVLSPATFAALDANKDKKLTKAELEAYLEGYDDVTDAKVMDFVLEEEWQLVSDVFGTGKDKEFDHKVLKQMAADSGLRESVEIYAENLYMGMYETLDDFEMAELDKEMAKELGEEMGEAEGEQKDLTKVKVTKKDALKKAAEQWKTNNKVDEDRKKAEAEAKAKADKEAGKEAGKRKGK